MGKKDVVLKSEKIIEKRFALAEKAIEKGEVDRAMVMVLTIEDLQRMRMTVLEEMREIVLGGIEKDLNGKEKNEETDDKVENIKEIMESLKGMRENFNL